MYPTLGNIAFINIQSIVYYGYKITTGFKKISVELLSTAAIYGCFSPYKKVYRKHIYRRLSCLNISLAKLKF